MDVNEVIRIVPCAGTRCSSDKADGSTHIDGLRSQSIGNHHVPGAFNHVKSYFAWIIHVFIIGNNCPCLVSLLGIDTDMLAGARRDENMRTLRKIEVMFGVYDTECLVELSLVMDILITEAVVKIMA